MGQLENIDHFVVLMLENRSFDNLLGVLYDKADDFDGLAGTEINPDPYGAAIEVWNNAGTDEATMRTPNPDPGELWTDINTQLFGTPTVAIPTPAPTMDGFVKNYLAQKNGPIGRDIMHYFTPKQVPVISTLAKSFAVCDRWFASAPCQTWPNRWFVHCATADGHENNEPLHLPDVETIYNRLEQAGMHDWKIYFHDLARGAAGSARSAAMKVAFISRARARPASSATWLRTRRTPSANSAFAIPRPMPDAAPVISAVSPSSNPILPSPS
jgi:phospholipase C